MEAISSVIYLFSSFPNSYTSIVSENHMNVLFAVDTASALRRYAIEKIQFIINETTEK